MNFKNSLVKTVLKVCAVFAFLAILIAYYSGTKADAGITHYTPVYKMECKMIDNSICQSYIVYRIVEE